MKNQLDVYAWFEFDLCQIVPEIWDTLMPTEDQNNEEDLEDEGSCFVKKQGMIINNCYFFSFFNAGWENLHFRVFLEMSEDPKIELINAGFPSFVCTIFGSEGAYSIKDSEEISETDEPNYSDDFENFGNIQERNDVNEEYTIGLISPGSLCRIQGILYRPKIVSLNLQTFLILSPEK